MTHSQFVHLHNHTEYSLLDGACRILNNKGHSGELIAQMAHFKLPALAITDHGNMYGVIEFYKSCIESGIEPIIGCELYVAPKSRLEKNEEKENKHLVLLAKDYEGYQNLIKLVSIANVEGFYYKPRIDKESLSKFNKGLICLSACLKGELASTLLKNDDMAAAAAVIEEHKSFFGRDNYYIELMDHDLPDQKKILPKLIELAKTTNTPVIATNDCHYLTKADSYSQEVLICIDTGKMMADTNRLKFATSEFYYKSPEEMIKLFNYIPEAIKNTLAIKEKCNLNLDTKQLFLPKFTVPEKFKNSENYLRHLCETGLNVRYPEYGKNAATTELVKNRMEHELSVIKQCEFASYFLIVWDFVHFAKNNNIPVGPGRGSGAGSIVSYLLGITNLCPLKYGLLFERFLNSERQTMPDLDIDFADTGRDTVIDYVRNKYGEKNVAQIITFGSMKAKLVVRDVARVLGLPVAEGDRIAKLLPADMTIPESIAQIPEVKKEYNTNPQTQNLLNIARKLEGLKRHIGVHAAGLVIGSDEITKFTPLSRSSKKTINDQEVITTQYSGEILTELGLLKMDFLGLRNLTIIDKTNKLISNPVTFENLPLDDKKTFKLLQEAKTNGIFQLESQGMKDLIRKLQPTVIDDIIPLVALYRPGPIRSGMVDEFVQRKHQHIKTKYEHPLLEPILKETYGVIVYQEQVMKIATDLAGFSMLKADDLRRAMGKKKIEAMEKQREDFMTGTKKNSIPQKTAEKIFDQMSRFGEYGFNKSHAAAYGLLAYQTGYLKANYPLEFMCALLNSEIGRGSSKEEIPKLTTYIQETNSLGIKILPPDIQKSDVEFIIENGQVRFGLTAIKNVGDTAAKNLVSARRKNGPFKSVKDFMKRIDPRVVNKKVLESLIKAGAFDTLGLNQHVSLPGTIRSRIWAEIDIMSRSKDDYRSGQESLFDFTADKLDETQSWAEHEMLTWEKDVLGFYLSGHPMAQYKKVIDFICTTKINNLPDNDSAKIRLAGMIAGVQKQTSKKGEQFAKFILENFDGEINVIVFPQNYKEGMSKFLALNTMVVVKGRLSTYNEKQELIAEEISLLDEYEKKYVKHAKLITLKFSSVGIDEIFTAKLKKLIDSHPGDTQVYFTIVSAIHPKGITVEIPGKVLITDRLLTEVTRLLGDSSFEIT